VEAATIALWVPPCCLGNMRTVPIYSIPNHCRLLPPLKMLSVNSKAFSAAIILSTSSMTCSHTPIVQRWSLRYRVGAYYVVSHLYLTQSAISNSTPLADWIMEQFPTSPDIFSSSLTEKLLARFSLFFLLTPLPLPILEIRKMTDYRRSVVRAPKVFETLLAMSFIDDGSHVVDEEEELRDTNLVKRKHKSQRKNKQAMRGVNTVKPESFKALAISVPNTRQNAEEIALGILSEQKLILEVSIGSSHFRLTYF